MREIKFRGHALHDFCGEKVDKFVFGDLIHMTDRLIGIIFDTRIAAVEVKLENVAQLVGYDANGKEVYEGDKLIDRNGRRIKAALRPNFTSIAVLEEDD